MDTLNVTTSTKKEAADPSPAPTNVIEAIVAVMRDVRAVGKDGYNSQNNFLFRGIDDTINALGPAMRSSGLVVIPTILHYEQEFVEVGNKRTRMASTKVQVKFTFYGPGGVEDKVEAVAPGEAFDSGDKGTAKAMSVAFRTALFQSFALPTQERDPDADSHQLSPTLTGETVLKAVADALDNAQTFDRNPIEALKEVWDEFTEPALERVTVEHNGQKLTGSAYINGWVQHFRQAAADSNAKQSQTKDDDSRASDAKARANEAQDAHENARTSGPRALLDSEIAGQAESLGIPVAQHIQSLLAMSVGSTSPADLPPGVVHQWVSDQRATVIEALRAAGQATLADAYAKLEPRAMIHWSQLTAQADEQTERVPQRA